MSSCTDERDALRRLEHLVGPCTITQTIEAGRIWWHCLVVAYADLPGVTILRSMGCGPSFDDLLRDVGLTLKLTEPWRKRTGGRRRQSSAGGSSSAAT